MTQSLNILFIGFGEMASCLAESALRESTSSFDHLSISALEMNADRVALLSRHDIFSRVTFFKDTQTAFNQTYDIVILSVKPQDMERALQGITPFFGAAQNVVFVSIAAGLSLAWLAERWGLDRNKTLAIVRVMPNTPTRLGFGVSGLIASACVSDVQKKKVESFFGCGGLTLWVENEDLLDSVAAISGSGPAYFFYFMRALVRAGVDAGFEQGVAHALVVQTAMGAAHMAQDATDLEELQRKVTSKGGVTQAALEIFTQEGLDKIVVDATRANRKRSQELG